MLLDHILQVPATSYLSVTSSSVNHVFIHLHVQDHSLHPAHRPYHRSYRLQNSLPSFPRTDHTSTGHILTSMVAGAFYHCTCSGVSDAESLTGHTVNIGFTAGSSIKCHIADDDILIWLQTGVPFGGYTTSFPPESPFPK